MAIRLVVRNNKQIVVPIRFARAVTGATDPTAPDVDDRGFAMGTRPGTWGSTDTRGAMVSVAEGDTIQVKVLCEDIDPGVQLFVTSTDSNMASIAGPAGPLGGDGVFSLKGVKDSKNVPVKIQVHLGDDKGPVLGELEPHIFQLRQLRVRAHLISINPPSGTRDTTSTTSRTADSLVSFFQDVNKIWRAAGIEFLYDPAQTRIGNISGFGTRGQVSNTPEVSRILNLQDAANGDRPDPNAINVYFVLRAKDFIGGTLDNEVARPDGFGVVLADSGGTPLTPSNPQSLAHELGHYLNSDLHADENSAAQHRRDDVDSERRLMYAFAFLGGSGPPDYRLDAGYEPAAPGLVSSAGALISVKKLNGDPGDGEIARNRLRALAPN